MILLAAVIALSGCGAFDRFKVSMTGNASNVCMSGVLYYQFTSGTSVALDQDGKVVRCD